MTTWKDLNLEVGMRVANRGDRANVYQEGEIIQLHPSGSFVGVRYDGGQVDSGVPVSLFVRPAMGGKPRLVVL